MDVRKLFTQESLDKLIGKDSGKPLHSQTKSDVKTDISLIHEKDILNRQVQTNRYSDLSRLGNPAEIPEGNLPQEKETETIMRPPPQMQTDNHSTSTDLSGGPLPSLGGLYSDDLTSSEIMILGFVKQLLDNNMLSSAFCDRLAQMLCDNSEFMTNVRSQILQKLI